MSEQPITEAQMQELEEALRDWESKPRPKIIAGDGHYPSHFESDPIPHELSEQRLEALALPLLRPLLGDLARLTAERDALRKALEPFRHPNAGLGYGDYYGPEWDCVFCGAVGKEPSFVNHTDDCPITVARGVVTGGGERMRLPVTVIQTDELDRLRREIDELRASLSACVAVREEEGALLRHYSLFWSDTYDVVDELRVVIGIPQNLTPDDPITSIWKIRLEVKKLLAEAGRPVLGDETLYQRPNAHLSPKVFVVSGG